jgi:hypothetical protein
LTEDGAVDGDLIDRHDTGRLHDGYMTLEEFKEKTKNVFDWSETN